MGGCTGFPWVGGCTDGKVGGVGVWVGRWVRGLSQGGRTGVAGAMQKDPYREREGFPLSPNYPRPVCPVISAWYSQCTRVRLPYLVVGEKPLFALNKVLLRPLSCARAQTNNLITGSLEFEMNVICTGALGGSGGVGNTKRAQCDVREAAAGSAQRKVVWKSYCFNSYSYS